MVYRGWSIGWQVREHMGGAECVCVYLGEDLPKLGRNLRPVAKDERAQGGRGGVSEKVLELDAALEAGARRGGCERHAT